MLTRKSTASLLTLAEGDEAACHEILHAYAYCKISRGNTRSSLTKKLGAVKERVDATGWGTPLHRAFRQVNDTLDNARTSWGGKGVEGTLAELQRAKTAHGQRAWAAACGNPKKYAKALAKMDADSYTPRAVGVLYESSPVEADPQVWQPRVKEENPVEHTRRARSHGNLRAQPPPDDVPMPPPPMGRMRVGSQSSVALSDPGVVASGSGRARMYGLESAAASQASLGRASVGEAGPYSVQRMLDGAPPMPQRTDSPSPRERGPTPRPYAQERPPSPRLAPSRHQHTPSQTSINGRRPQRAQTVDSDMYMQAPERPRHQHSPSQTSINSRDMPRPHRSQTFDSEMYMQAPERPRHQHTPSQSSIDSINRMRPQRSQTFDQRQASPAQDMYMPVPERPRHQHSPSQSSIQSNGMPRPQRSQTLDQRQQDPYMQSPERPRHQHSASQSSVNSAGMPRPQRSQTFDRQQGVQLVDRPLPRAQTFNHNQESAYTQPRAVPAHKHSASQSSFTRF